MQRTTLINALIAIALFVAILALLMLNPGLRKCDSAECLLESANGCIPASGRMEQAGLVLDVLSSKGCAVTFTVVALEGSEPLAIGDLLIGRQMVCASVLGYEEIFRMRDLTSCSGSLKDALYEISLVLRED